jgi:amphi-Trp domain-containing protein
VVLQAIPKTDALKLTKVEEEGGKRFSMQDLDIERIYGARETAMKLRRIAAAMEDGRPFRLQVDGRRIRVPAGARVEIEIEREDREGEFDIEIKWTRRRP